MSYTEEEDPGQVEDKYGPPDIPRFSVFEVCSVLHFTISSAFFSKTFPVVSLPYLSDNDEYDEYDCDYMPVNVQWKDEIIKKCYLKSNHIVDIKWKETSLFENDMGDQTKGNQDSSSKENVMNYQQEPSIEVIIQLVSVTLAQITSSRNSE